MPVALALLLVWNLVLTIMLIRNLQKNTTGNSTLEDMNSINYTTSDYTSAIEKSRSSVVTVESDGSYYSGIIIAKEKETVHILTTAKATKNGSPNVVFDSGVRVSSTVMGDDGESGVAMIQVTTNFEVKPFTILDTAALAQGANVVVMSGRNLTTGSAIVSSGIVSEPGVWRMNGTTTWLSSMLEMDTPITSIQEGGAVIDLNGSLVGVVASQPFQGNSRMEYAITANEIKLIYNALKTNGKVTRGALGVVVRNVSSMLAYEKNAQGINIDMKTGVYVQTVVEKKDAGDDLQVGDIITMIDGIEISSYQDVLARMYMHSAGDTVNVSIIRGGESKQIGVVLQ